MRNLEYSRKNSSIFLGDTKLSLSQRVLLKEKLDKLYASSEKIRFMDVQAFIKATFNVMYSLSGTRHLLKKIGY